MEYKIDQRALFMKMWNSLHLLVEKVTHSTNEEALQKHIKNALSVIKALGELTRQMVDEDTISMRAGTQILRELADTAGLVTLVGMIHLVSLAPSGEESDDDDLIEDSDADGAEFKMPDEWEDMT